MTVGRGILVAGEARTAIMWSRLTSVRFLAVGTGSLGRSGAAGVLQAVNTASVGPAATRAMAFNPRRQQEESELEMKLIEVKRTVQMTAKGRMRTMSALVCVGNGNGGIGYATGKGDTVQQATNKALLRAVRRIVYVPRVDDGTIFHKVSAKYKQTRVHMWQARPGHGVRAHRAIMGICELAGITDLGGRVTGSTNPLNLVRATFDALQSQLTPEELGRQHGKSVLSITHPDQPPTVLYRHKEAQLQDQAAALLDKRAAALQATRDWLHSSPFEPEYQQYRDVALLWKHAAAAEDETLDPEARQKHAEAMESLKQQSPSVFEWAFARPDNALLSGTVLDPRLFKHVDANV